MAKKTSYAPKNEEDKNETKDDYNIITEDIETRVKNLEFNWNKNENILKKIMDNNKEERYSNQELKKYLICLFEIYAYKEKKSSTLLMIKDFKYIIHTISMYIEEYNKTSQEKISDFTEKEKISDFTAKEKYDIIDDAFNVEFIYNFAKIVRKASIPKDYNNLLTSLDEMGWTDEMNTILHQKVMENPRGDESDNSYWLKIKSEIINNLTPEQNQLTDISIYQLKYKHMYNNFTNNENDNELIKFKKNELVDLMVVLGKQNFRGMEVVCITSVSIFGAGAGFVEIILSIIISCTSSTLTVLTTKLTILKTLWECIYSLFNYTFLGSPIATNILPWIDYSVRDVWSCTIISLIFLYNIWNTDDSAFNI